MGDRWPEPRPRVCSLPGVTCFIRTASLVIVAFLAWAPPARANAILNGGFETATLSDWTMTPAASGSMAYVSGHAHSGRDALWFGATGAFST